MDEVKTISEEQRAKISEGMKRSHARRKRAKQNAPASPARSQSLLGRLIEERDALNIVIAGLKQRGVS